MLTSQERLQTAMKYAMANRSQIGGFPFLAECLRQAGVQHNIWTLPALQSMYVMSDGVVVQNGTPLITSSSADATDGGTGVTGFPTFVDVPVFNEELLIAALRTDQAGQSTFPEFLKSTWSAGVVNYDVDFIARIVSYHGSRGEKYVESYPAVEVGDIGL